MSEDSLITGPITETPIDEGRPVEPALDWEYTNEAPRPHVIVEATTPTVGTLGTTEPSDISLNYTQVAADEGYSFELTATAQPGQSITWTSADPAVATVTPTGDNTALVTSLRAGETAITATLENGDVAVCTVYATVADGVYYIATNNLYLGVDGSLLEYTPMKLLGKQTTGPAKIRQLWKIHYYGSGSVSVRSLYKLDMGLYSSDANKVSITTVGTGVAVPNANRWTIVQEDAGYVFQHVGTSSKCMCAEAGSFAPQTKVVTAPYSANRTGIHWTLQEDTSVVSQVLLINTAHGLPAHNAVRYVMTGETITLADMNLTASFVSRYTNAQNFQWLAIEDSSEKIVRVNQSTGAVTGVAEGRTTITAKTVFNGADYTTTYTIVVLPFQNGTYFIKNREFDRYLQIDNNDSPDYDTAGAIMEQWEFDGGAYQKWTLTSLNNGYYKIISAQSGKALTVAEGDISTTNVSLVQESYSGANRQQWKITQTDAGYFKIKPRSSEDLDDDLAMAVGWGLPNDVNGINIEQRVYADDEDYQDEWQVCNFDTSLLMAIEDVDGAARDEYFAFTEEHLQTVKNSMISTVSTIEFSECTVTNMISYLKSSDIFIIHTHGNKDRFQIGDGSVITMQNLQNTDLSNIDLAVLLTCRTGRDFNRSNIENNDPQNMVEQMVVCGAETVIGFSEDTYVSDCNNFAPDLMKKIIKDGLSVQDAVDSIEYKWPRYLDNMADIAVIGGNVNNYLR